MTTLALLLCSAVAISSAWQFGLVRGRYTVGGLFGAIYVSYGEQRRPGDRCFFRPLPGTRPHVAFWPDSLLTTWKDSPDWIFVLPLWPLATIGVGATGLLWWLRLRRVPAPGCCPSCGYALAGLAEGAKCPECGKVQNG